MDEYDVVVAGGGIGGSVAARLLAKGGCRTLLIERFKTPRNKPCSGIQFPYLEKLVGARIPRDRLCRNDLSRVEMITPDGRVLRGHMKMLNFWRSTFDRWLNTLAGDAGARFRDESRLLDFHDDGEGLTVAIGGRNSTTEVRAHYLVAGDGLNSTVRRRLRPQDFGNRRAGAAINYYFAGNAALDPNTLYMFYDRQFAPIMFAWAYLKDDHWVIGTGAEEKPLEYAERFLSYVQEKYAVRGEMVKREGFASPMESEVFLGEGRVLMTGDAAGLIDLYRGLGMDNAALSGRLAAKAIMQSIQTACPPVEPYRRLMKRTVRTIEASAKKQAARYATNESLAGSLSPLNLARDGLLMTAATGINKLLPPERTIMLPL